MVRYVQLLQALDEKFKLEVIKFENHLQISKSTYELLFDKKINAYNSLMELRNKYYRYKHESVVIEEDPLDAMECFYRYFIDCKSIIEDNSLYISEELSSCYDDWMVLAIQYFKQESIDGFKAHGMAYTDDENQQNIYDAQFSARYALVDNTQESMELIFEQVIVDLGRIRKLVSMPLN